MNKQIKLLNDCNTFLSCFLIDNVVDDRQAIIDIDHIQCLIFIISQELQDQPHYNPNILKVCLETISYLLYDFILEYDYDEDELDYILGTRNNITSIIKHLR